MNIEKLFLLQSFSLAWHWANSAFALVEDKESYTLLGETQYRQLKENATKLAKYFFPQLDGRYALRQFMNRYLCPLPVADRLFWEKSLKTAEYTGTKQLVLINQGYCTFPFRKSGTKLKIIDINTTNVTLNKHKLTVKMPASASLLLADSRDEAISLLQSDYGFDNTKPAFVVVGCMPIFMDTESLEKFMSDLGSKLASGSSVVFCYGDENFYTDEAGKCPQFIKSLTAKETGCGYTYPQIEKLLSQRGFLIYEHLSREEMHQQYFDSFASFNASPLCAPDNVCYVLAVKKETKA